MKRLVLLLVCSLLIGVVVYGITARADTPLQNEQEIKALEQRFVAAVKGRDINAIMSAYDENVFVFDLVPPREYVGAKVFKQDWDAVLAAFPGPIEFDITNLSITTDGNLGYSHSIQYVTLTDNNGAKSEFTLRVTDVYRKTDGKWSIIHEHVSAPDDLETGKADLSSKP